MVIEGIDAVIKIVRFLDVPFIEIDQRLCSNSYYKDSCGTCKDVCPVDALKIERGISIDSEACVRCGSCSTACHNGVFNMLDPSDESILSKIDDISTENVIFGCNGCHKAFKVKTKKIPKDSGEIIVPCLGRLNEIMLLSCHEAGLDISFQECNSKCPYRSAMKSLDEALILTDNLMKTFNVPPIEEKPDGSLKTRSQEIHGRRGFFYEAGQRAAMIAMDRDAKREREHKPPINQKRESLMAYCKKLEPKDYAIKRDGLPFAEIRINNTCDLCGICSRICPTRALKYTEDEENATITFEFSKCTGCELCLKICEKGSLQIKEDVNLGKLMSDPITLQSMPLTNCTKCDKRFISISDEEFCLQCKKTERLKKSFLENVETIRT